VAVRFEHERGGIASRILPRSAAPEALLDLAEEDRGPAGQGIAGVKAEDRVLGRLTQVDGLEDGAGLRGAPVDQDGRRADISSGVSGSIG